MPTNSLGPVPEKRALCLFKALLLFAAGEVENSHRFDIKYCWLEDQQPPQLRIETRLRILKTLTNSLGEDNLIQNKEQIRQALKQMEHFLHILKDERVQKRGKDLWRFSLILWSKDITENLRIFAEEWNFIHPKRLK